MKKFDITYFNGPPHEYFTKPETVADIAAAGITLVPIMGDLKTNREVLTLLRQYGLRAVVSDTRLGPIYGTDNIAAADEAVKQIVADYADFENVIGWDLVDEPHSKKFPILAAIVNAFRRYSPDKETVINLFPNYADPAVQLGNPDYISHLEEFVNVVRPHFISYDHYHFLGRTKRKETLLNSENIDEREMSIRISAAQTEDRGGFFENIEDVRNVALKYGLDAMLIVLLVEHGLYRNLTYGELLWEVNMCLAYGFKRISYFTYWTPPYDACWEYTNAMCDTEGKKMQHYYDAQKINSIIRPVGEYLFDRTSVGVYHLGESEKGTAQFESFGKIKKIDGDNGVIGCFDDGTMYLVNRDFLKENTFTLHVTSPLTVMRDGYFTDLTSENSVLITLAPGEGVLLK